MRTPTVVAVAVAVVMVVAAVGSSKVSALHTEVPANRLHGIAKSAEGAYAAEEFRCADGSGVIPVALVNDDYCDCIDGSDEPGTSACNNGRFYCVNKGHVGQYLPSSRVNDGICDCCDGSDESQHSSVQCDNTCEAVAEEYRRIQAERIRRLEEGARAKLAYVTQGNEAKAKITADLAAKRSELVEAKASVATLTQEVAVEEALEKQEIADRVHTKRATMSAALGIDKKDADELRALVLTLAARANVTHTLVEMLNEEAEAAWDKLAAQAGEAGAAPPAKPEPVAWPEEGEEAGAYERPEAAQAREKLADAESEEATLEADIERLEGDEKEDFGPENEWWPLHERCLEATISKYKYTICPFKNAKQDHTNLGSWDGFEDGYNKMKFKNGQSCWNGPQRSLTVEIECGIEERIASVDEPSTCTYVAKVVSPAACDSHYAKELDLTIEPAQEAKEVEPAVLEPEL